MIMAEKRKTYPAVPLYPTVRVSAYSREENPEGERVEGADGKLIYPGRTVRRLAHFAPLLNSNVGESYGVVDHLYRQPGIRRANSTCDVVVATTDGRFFWADQCVRSSAGQAAEAWKKRREKNKSAPPGK